MYIMSPGKYINKIDLQIFTIFSIRDLLGLIKISNKATPTTTATAEIWNIILY